MKNGKLTIKNELFGVFFAAIGIFFSLSLASYDPADPALNAISTVQEINNLGGIVGAYTADILFSTFGISAYFLCLVIFLISFMQFVGRNISLNWKEAAAYAMLLISVAAILHIRFETIHLHNQPIEAGGLLGGLFGQILKKWLGNAGAYVISSTLAVLSLLYSTHLSVVTVASLVKKYSVALVMWLTSFAIVRFEQTKKWIAKISPVVIEKIALLWKKIFAEKKKAVKVALSHKQVEKTDAPAETQLPPQFQEQSSGPKIFERADAKPVKAKDSQLMLARMSKDYSFPPISLLDSPEQKVSTVDEEALKRNSVLLEKKLKDYGVEGRVTEIHPGPVITMYEFEPAPGVKIGKIVNLEDDLSVTMGGRSVRIVAHLPGKAAIGIEIPNNEREIVWLKDIVSDPKFRRSNSRLTFALGKNIEGHPVITDLSKMPHLLVAGATGSGKSVAINTMIVSILYKATPEDVRMILIDPKMLELPIYDGITHLLLPVVTKPRKAVLALQWAVHEMERRYTILADAGVRNIAGYNEKIEKGALKVISIDEAAKIQETNKEAVCHTGKIPCIVIIIDELADLMMVASKDMEESITRLAQMARAAGIHLILATQRPSVDVITGLIKANFPARMAFKVSGQHDSRTIIDTVGAEKLLGMGDMLFMPPNTSDILRLHGGFITEGEIARVVAHVKEQGRPVYDETIVEEKNVGEDGLPAIEQEYDELYDVAVKLVAETKQASISMIQRRFRIGYNRAARLVEKMEAEGVVGPADGAKPREVLVSSLQERG
ncbi:MAG: DNA translocase FtsK 4TM domain-containing protein [Deltaproteobacteria bacterium]|nr:DNA translocase FtsK 4TM domain-containing protein [Deltaproteobacteria bacterium]